MRIYHFLIAVLLFCSNSYGQDTIKRVLSKEETNLLLKDLNEDKILSNVSSKVCNCIDSIKIGDKNQKELSLEVKECINKDVLGFQMQIILLESLKSGSNSFDFNVNIESEEYKLAYYKIERRLLDSCSHLKNIVKTNDVENKNSVSENRKALEQYSLGIRFMEKEKYEEALSYFEKAVKIDPNFAFAWDNVGYCNRKLNKLDAAIKAYEKSISIDPNGKFPLQNIAIAYIYKKQYDKAIKSYEKLMKLDEHNPEVYYGLGQVYFMYLEDNEKGLDYTCKAYNLYIEINSPYRTDAETVINMIHKKMKSEKKEKEFYNILKKNNINVVNK